MIEEDNLNPQSKAVIAILRKEIQSLRRDIDASKLSEDSLKAIQLLGSVGVVGGFVIKLAGVIIAAGILFSAWSKR
jgi:hypothetical protein